MQAIILAAGTGSRLGHMTESLPKALVRVAGKPLLSYTIAFARLAGCTDILVVVGAFGHKTVDYLNTLSLPELRWVENRYYLKGNLYSLGAAILSIRTSFLLLNTDHLYRAEIAKSACKQCRDIIAFCDRDRNLGPDDMKVKTDRRDCVVRISKQLTDYDAGYVGMTYCDQKMLDSYLKAYDRVAARHDDQAVVEMILGDLAQTSQPPSVGDISGVGWLEVDTPEEHSRAEKSVLGAPEEFVALEL